MRYLIDTANMDDINKSLALGIRGVTANPSMYLKENVNFLSFIRDVNDLNPEILTAEVIETDLDDMINQADKILSINKNIIIKINFSMLGLNLINLLNKRGVQTACTLIFNVNQASLAINAGANYIFPFIGRNDENGYDGLEVINNICKMIKDNSYTTKVVAASIKNVYHLEKAALAGAHYAAITFDTLQKAMHHDLTVNGAKTFIADWSKLS